MSKTRTEDMCLDFNIGIGMVYLANTFVLSDIVNKNVAFVCFQDNLVCFFETLCSTNSVFFGGEGIGIGHLSDSSQFLGEIVKGSLLLIKR